MLKVVKAQGQGLVSDAGRWGFQHEGVPVGGVLDSFSFAIGNLALGNSENFACLELMGQFDFVCAKPCRLFLANRGAVAFLNHRVVRSGQVLSLQEGDVFKSQPPGHGFWNMVCVQGGVDVPLAMGSRSTCLSAGFGGLQGRALQVGDEIHAGHEFSAQLKSGVRLALPLADFDSQGRMPIHCLAGPEFSLLDETSRQAFSSQAYRLGVQSSRMGYRLECSDAQLRLSKPCSLASHAVHPGLVQLPPSGHPVVLLSECQVTGGYPRLASVLGCELWKFAQLSTGQVIQWVMVDFEQAERLEQQHLRRLKQYHHMIESNTVKCHVD